MSSQQEFRFSKTTIENALEHFFQDIECTPYCTGFENDGFWGVALHRGNGKEHLTVLSEASPSQGHLLCLHLPEEFDDLEQWVRNQVERTFHVRIERDHVWIHLDGCVYLGEPSSHKEAETITEQPPPLSNALSRRSARKAILDSTAT